MLVRRSPRTRAVVALVLLFTIATPVGAADRDAALQPRTPGTPASDGSWAEFVPGELIVRFAAGTPAAGRQQAVEAIGGRLAHGLRSPGLALVTLPAGADTRAAAARLARQAGILYAEPNFLYRLSATPDDPRFAEMWGLDASDDHDIDARSAWNVTTGSDSVLVAVVDSGIDASHPDLEGNIWTNPGEGDTENGIDDDGNGLVDDLHGWDFVDGDNEPEDGIGHGTHVAGTIGANGDNGQGITGVAWDVSLLPIRAGDVELTTEDLVDSFDYACDMGAQVVNASFGGPDASALDDAIAACPGTLFVVAAGNDGGNNDDPDEAHYPCAYPNANIVCVAASDRADQLASFSNFGATTVDLAAPGVSILSATPREVLFADGFETTLDAWVAESPGGISWSRTDIAAASGSGSATDSAGGLYANGSNTWLRTASPIDLSAGSGCQLDYAVRFHLQQAVDWLLVEGREDGGAWRVIDSGAPGNLAWTGNTNGAWIDWSEDLAADGFGGTTSFEPRFRLVSDGSTRHDGAYLDDVAMHCLTGSHGTDDFVRFSGTSMATPHVVGVAALLLSAYPDATVAALKSALLQGGDRVLGLVGKVSSGRRLNARGALDELDVVRPVAARPGQQLTGSTLGTRTVPLRVSWAAATDADPSSGIDRYQVDMRTRIGGTWRAWKKVGTTTATAMTVELRAGIHQFRTRAQDGAGNWSAYRTGSSLTLAAPQGGAIGFVPSWNTQVSSDFFDGSTRWSGALQASASHTFTGREVAWIGTRGPNRGRAKVYIDGSLAATVDLYAATHRHRRVLFSADWGSAGVHTIKVKVISKGSLSSGTRVDADAFITLN